MLRLQQTLVELGDILGKALLKALQALLQKLFASVEISLLFIYDSAKPSCPIWFSARQNQQKKNDNRGFVLIFGKPNTKFGSES